MSSQDAQKKEQSFDEPDQHEHQIILGKFIFSYLKAQLSVPGNTKTSFDQTGQFPDCLHPLDRGLLFSQAR
jgi:hypothetical protein